MKAFLLAAGLGTRLRPVTDVTPKCMLPVGGRPLLSIWLDALAEVEVTDVFINLHHLPDVVTEYLDSRSWPVQVYTEYEPELRGSAGTLRSYKGRVKYDEFFLACYADGLTDFPLADLISAHREHQPIATIAVHHSSNPSIAGIVETDADGVMTGFTEKPEHPVSDIANSGIYAFAPAVLDEISSDYPQDIGHHLLPRLVGRARTVPVTGYFRDIGTPEAYQRAQEEWKT
jgi:mannose-1-phosphate guanylyltransferase